MSHRILLVDDEPSILNSLRRVFARKVSAELNRYEIKIETFDSPQKALDRAREVAFAVVISDYRMPLMNGVAFLTSFKALQPLATRMILSGYADMRALVAAINEAHIQSYLGKPWDDDELRSSLAQAIAIYDKLVESEGLADLARSQQGVISPSDAALKRLEAKNPALVRVNWAPNGGVMLEHDDDE